MQVMSTTRDLDSDKPGTLTAFFKASDEFLAKYGSHKLAPRMQQAQLRIAAEADTPEAQAALQKIAAGKDEELASAAKEQIEKQKRMAGLKTKPLELKFTAVDGSEVDLAKMRGKVVLIDFWATWCGPCVGEVPHVVEAYKKLHDKGFEIVGISLDQNKEKLLAFTKEKGVTWPQYFDGKGWQNEISSKFGIDSIPAMWLIDKQGMLATTQARGDLAGEVEKLLAK
jgi:thiol-disulfide isomerase/thioredoxin